MNVTEAAENYLEAILMLSENKSEIHAADICAHLGFSRPTVSVMLKTLRQNGYVTVDELNHVRLTETGTAIAMHVYERHKILSALFISLGVTPATAYEDACKVEHDLSAETFARICEFVQALENAET